MDPLNRRPPPYPDPGMATRRIRIDVQEGGNTTSLRLEGNITRKRVLEVFDMLGLADAEAGGREPDLGTVGSRIWNIVDRFFPTGKFTSNNVLEKFEDEYNEPIKLSVISTYLSRFSSRGRVDRTRTGKEWTYQAARTPPARR